MKNIVLYSPPAAGKGTQCSYLVDKYGYKVLSIGEVLRKARSTETEIGRIIIENQDKGTLVPDDITLKALQDAIKDMDESHLIIDGYPRNINQAKSLDTILDNYIVINLQISRDEAVKRALGRVNCKECNKIYNIYFNNMKPKNEGICDYCGKPLQIRSDDNESSFNVRFDIYENNSPEILEYYRNKNILNIVDSSISKEATFEQIENILKEVSDNE